MAQQSLSWAEADGDILARYETIRDYSRMMQHYARAADWDRLIELQAAYVGAMQALADAEQRVTLSAGANDHKVGLIGEIRGAESEVRACLDRRMTELSRHMADSRHRQHAAQAYENQGHA
ncbi:flagellar protein FliT [Salinisphaera sp.]|uniref:flagellar protein FliT n=1 Tax=Salinisphaera sp. TaxID=1914330 RepID=UPI002D76E2B5|nr:flagellar protein FliT [Salinisphaera sp.]HET7313524.1 flagellar protein FliT [Salinisphaera sp.]